MKVLYKTTGIPIFQNKVYATIEEAKRAATGDIELTVNPLSKMINNSLFNESLMDYDENYQNEQNHSPYFQSYLEQVSILVESFILKNKSATIIEIGCGKGYFLENLRSKGYSVTGYDPTYEGNADYIIKKYFGVDNHETNGDLIILRHTMEHIADPLSFLHTVKKANGGKGGIFIEVPTFDWILENKAFWDVFYEHCNYFNEKSFANLFKKAQTGRLFGGQYMYIYADLSDLKEEVIESQINETDLATQFVEPFRQWMLWLDSHYKEGIIVWGAGAKGSTFLNLLDKDRALVKYVVDVSPRKQGRYIAVTGHSIMTPETLLSDKTINHIIVMNPNYLDEIIQMLPQNRFQISVL